MEQYLDSLELLKNLPTHDVFVTDLGTTDTYNESKIIKKVLSYNISDQKLLLKAALQISLIGSGNKSYGFVKDDKGNPIELVDLFKRLNIKYNIGNNSKLEDDELSPRRLVRLFRYHIRNFINKTGKCSYLWIKYADKTNKKYHEICFPGAEHLVKDEDEATFLYKVYENVDKIHKTNFCSRLIRVYIARNVISMESDIYRH